jgi:hypothetical protein
MRRQNKIQIKDGKNQMEEKMIQTNAEENNQHVEKTVKYLISSYYEEGEATLSISKEPSMGFDSWEISELVAQHFAKWKTDVAHAIDNSYGYIDIPSNVFECDFVWMGIEKLLKYIEVDLRQGLIHKIPCIILNDQIHDMLGYSDKYISIHENGYDEGVYLKGGYLFSEYKWGAVAMYVLQVDNNCSFSSQFKKQFVVKDLHNSEYSHGLYTSAISRRKNIPEKKIELSPNLKTGEKKTIPNANLTVSTVAKINPPRCIPFDDNFF